MNLSHRRTRGSVATYCLFAMGVLLIASVGVSGTAMSSITRAKGDQRAMIAFQAAQGALEHGISKAYAYAKANKGAFPSVTYDLSGDVAPIAPGCVASARVVPDPAYTSIAWITVNTTYKGKTYSLRSYLRAKDVGIWNNAIFAGQGASGRAINGNVDIRGSLHILGEGESYTDLNGNGVRDVAEVFTDKNKNAKWDPGENFVDANGDGVWTSAEPYNDANRNGRYEPPLTQADLNTNLTGHAYVGNNYSGLDPALKALVLPPPRIGGVETLGSEVRVKHGQLQIGGSAKIGTSAVVDAGLSKGLIDGSYVSDGYRGDSASRVFSENGTTNSYDLGTLDIGFPYIAGIGADPYKDPAPGSSTVYANQEAYLVNKGLLLNLSSLSSSSSSINLGPDAHGNYFIFKKESGGGYATIEFNGIIRVPGNFTMSGTMRYKGKGTFYSPGNVNLEGDLLPMTGQVFPRDSRLGWLAKGDMVVGSTSHVNIAGAFFAQGTVSSTKQSQIMGTLVGSFYDLGTNVPAIYQVPELSKNMPPGMPGDLSIISIKVRGWRER